MKVLEEYKAFTLRSHVADMAVGIIIGAVTINVGTFVNSAISFTIVSFAVFVLVRYINRLREPDAAPEPAAPTMKKCPHCVSDIPIAATRCPHCTSTLEDDAPNAHTDE